MFSVAKILELIALSNQSVDELNRNTPKLVKLKENINCTKEEKGTILRKFMEDTVQYKQELIDGVKIFINRDTNVLCIPDKDKNLVHLNVESATAKNSKELMKEFKAMVESYVKTD